MRRGESLTVEIDGNSIDLTGDDVLIGTEQATGWACSDEDGLQVALSMELTDELTREGMARDFVRHVQQLRKDADWNIQDRISRILCSTDDSEVKNAIDEWSDYISTETLANAIEFNDGCDGPAFKVGSSEVRIAGLTVADS